MRVQRLNGLAAADSEGEGPFTFEIDYGERAEHCWNGDQKNGNHIARLRYNTMYLEKIMARIETSSPEGADTCSWRY